MASSNSYPSSSSSLPIGKWTYEVFLSFRGEDTRTSFVDHLYAALVKSGVYTFKDDQMLRIGKQITPELLKAIEESRSAMIIFSENYASSSWCLDELVKIMECQEMMGQRVLPVFYHVDPSDVRRQKGRFGAGFKLLEQGKFKSEPEKLEKWKEALVIASNISGFHFPNSERGESEFIHKIVRDILQNIKPYGMEGSLIGIESHIDKLRSLLDLEAKEEVRFVGIWGMGGLGKTTIARAIFRRILLRFEGSSFVENVRENSSNKKDICALQDKIIRDTVNTHPFMIQDPNEGAEMLQRRLSNMKVLLVLDDVDNVKQIECLAARSEWFGPGSRIIITTRNEHLISHTDEKYKPGLLLKDQAVELFSRHAFKKSRPSQGFEDLSYRAVRCTGYLPLALKVLGSFFHGRDIIVWDSALNRLSKTPDSEIFETLKLSFDGLHDSEKNIFLDIACFFRGKDQDHVTRILDSFGFDPVIGISVLIEKSLVTVSNKKLDMHDLIQEMGWKIVRDTFSYSRIWQVKEMNDLIMTNKIVRAIEAIGLRNNGSNTSDEILHIGANEFGRMKNLRLLDIDFNFPSDEPPLLPHEFRWLCWLCWFKYPFHSRTPLLPDELRWLCWFKYPFHSLPVGGMRTLVGLEMINSSIQHLWKGPKILSSLKFIDLRDSRDMTKFPDVLGSPNIERLILANCTSLVEVHWSLGFHRRLVYLDMSGCTKLKFLPSRIEMESLETLILSYCVSLERFPEVSSCMVNLSNISLDHCDLIKELPSSIRYVTGLKSLNLMSCISMERIPEELGRIENVRELLLGFQEDWIQGQWPKSISFHTLTKLCSLRKLDLSRRQIKVEEFPKNLHMFSSLEELHLSGNYMLTKLPVGISDLSSLKLLELNNCRQLQNLNGLPSGLQMLKAKGCSSLEKIEDLSHKCEWLYKIWLFDCHQLQKDQENERYLDKMVQQSFLKKCAIVDHRLSIGIPGSNVPSWFKEARNGCKIALNLPPNGHKTIMGFAVCGVFHGSWHMQMASPKIIFKIVNDEVSQKLEFDSSCVTSEAHYRNLWLGYIPFGFFQQMYHDLQPEDWAHIEGNLILTILRTDYDNNSIGSVRCGAHIFLKEDVEPILQHRTFISDYGDMVQVSDDDSGFTKVSGNTYVYEEMSTTVSRSIHDRSIHDRSIEGWFFFRTQQELEHH